MNDEELLAVEKLEAEMEAIKNFPKKEELVAAELEPTPEPEPAPAPAPELVKAKKAPKAKKEVKKEAPKPVAAPPKEEAPTRLYGGARLRARLGR